MASLAEQYDRIERYLQGAMTSAEQEAFAAKLENDAQLAAEVELHEELAETLAGERIHRFRQTLRVVDAKWSPRSGNRWLRMIRQPRNLAIAAGLLLLIGFFAWLSLQPLSGAALASEYFEQLPLQTQMGSGANEIGEIRKEAHEAYIADQYELAAQRFATLAELVPEDLSYQLFLGISQLGAGETTASVGTLKPLADGTNRTVQAEASWYLALAYLFNDEPAAARPYLEMLARNGGYQTQRAQELIDRLY